MQTLSLKIVTPEQIIFEGEVDMVNIPTDKGQLGILPHHINLMSRVTPGELVIKKNNKEEMMAIGDGLLQMNNGKLTIMTDLAINESDIDEKAVLEAKKRAEEALEEKLSSEEYAETLAILEKSLAQLRVKRRHRKI